MSANNQENGSFYFVIDTRENRLLKCYGEKINNKWVVKKKYEKYVKFRLLDCGDVCFYNVVDNNAVPVVLIERKEVKDLSSCIGNKSYKEQKMRMKKFQSENPTVQLIYLVENYSIATPDDLLKVVNPAAPKNHKKTRQVILSCLVGTMLRDNFYIMTTQGFDGTVAFIERIYKKWPEYKDELAKRTKGDIPSAETEYLKNVKVAKKQNIGPEQWYITSLAQIQGVSVDKATEVAKVYSNFKSLIDAYEKLETEKEREKMLKDIECGNRKLGPVCSKRIYEFLFQKSSV